MALTLCAFGHVATTAEILAAVHGQESIVDIYQQSSYLVRPRRGVYACAHLRDVELAALRAGGVLDCVSALRTAGAEVSDEGCLHVRFQAEGSRARPRPDLAGAPLVSHWSRVQTERRPAAANLIEHRFRRPVLSRSRLPAPEALRQALVCVPPEQLRGVIEAVTGTVLPFDEVRRVVSAAPRRVRAQLMRAW